VDLRIDVLRRFVVLAEELNVTRAAARLDLTQQGLSAQLKQLEAAVGVELLARSPQRVELTPAGAAFRDRALVVIAEADAAIRAARDAAVCTGRDAAVPAPRGDQGISGDQGMNTTTIA
jgi:DNA-binding transcriptional LysR family regulator